MAKGDRFWRQIERKNALLKADANGEVADSMTVRTALIERMHRGELTLEQVQAELAPIKRGAKAKGLKTRADFF